MQNGAVACWHERSWYRGSASAPHTLAAVLQVLQTLARQSLSGDLQAQAATSNTTLQDRARLLQLQLQLNQIQQQQQQVLQGQKHQGGGTLPSTSLDALQDQLLHAHDVLMQQQLQQQADTELHAGAEDQAQRGLEALRLLKGAGGRVLSPNGRAGGASPFLAQQPALGAGHLPMMPDMSRQLLGRERAYQAQEVRRYASAWDVDMAPAHHSGRNLVGLCAVISPLACRAEATGDLTCPHMVPLIFKWNAQASSACAGLPGRCNAMTAGCTAQAAWLHVQQSCPGQCCPDRQA